VGVFSEPNVLARIRYKTKFDYKTNSIKQVWTNLNTVCSLKKSKTKTSHIF